MKPQGSPTAADMLEETADLVCTMALYGPPVVFVAAPWLLLGLVLIGPFAVVVLLFVALLAAAALVVGIGALLMAPVLMLRRHRAARASIVRPANAVQVELA
jgi:hypothetical protein